MLNCFEVYFTVTNKENYTNVKRILTSTKESAIEYCKKNYNLKEVVSAEQLTPKKLYCKCCGQYEDTKHFSKLEIDNGTWEKYN